MIMDKVRVGVVGVGALAQEAHLPSYGRRQDVEVVAFADPEVARVQAAAEKFAKEHSKPVPIVYASIDDMIAAQGSNLDAVSICTPNVWHVPLALKALDAGYHVLLEKPMATKVEEARQLAERVKATGKVLMVGMSHRYREDVEALKRFIDSGELGDIYYAKTRILRRRGTPKGWFTDMSTSGGGPLMDIGVHALDLTWWLLGQPEPSRVSGYLHQGIGNDGVSFIHTWTAKSAPNQDNAIYDTEDFASAMVRFASGTALQLEVSWSLNGPEDDALKVEIFGSRGGVSLDPLRIFSTSHHVLTQTSLPVGMGPFFKRELDHFIDCVKAGETPISDVQQGLEVVRMLEGIATSSAHGAEVSI